MPVEPAFSTAAATATTATANMSSSRPISPLPQPHPHRHYPSPQQTLYPPQPQPQPQPPVPIRVPNHPQLTKPHDPSHPFLYPFSSPSARPFLPKGVRALSSTDHVVTVANPSGYPPHSLVYSHGVRAMASPHLDYLNHPLHVTRPPNLQYPPPHLACLASAGPNPIKGVGVPVSASPKGAPRCAVSDSNGYKDSSTRERSRDDAFVVVRDRKVRITEDASLYALCRSWLRNGINEETQPQQKDVMKALPKPMPASMVSSYMSNLKEDEKDEDEEEENDKPVEDLSPQDLLKRHVKRAKKVRARFREERSQRIKRYRRRLSLLLPPPVEQFRNDTAAGN